MEEELEKLTGTVEDITYFSEETGYCVAEISTAQEGVTIVGNMGELVVGSEIECVGKWAFHPSFGRQLKRSAKHCLPMQAECSAFCRRVQSRV